MLFVVVVGTVVLDGKNYSYDCFILYSVRILVGRMFVVLVESEVALLVEKRVEYLV